MNVTNLEYKFYVLEVDKRDFGRVGEGYKYMRST
jgi:hypothetical protein